MYIDRCIKVTDECGDIVKYNSCKGEWIELENGVAHEAYINCIDLCWYTSFMHMRGDVVISNCKDQSVCFVNCDSEIFYAKNHSGYVVILLINDEDIEYDCGCDECGRLLTDHRELYVCHTCSDQEAYDMCENCYRYRNDSHSGHSITRAL